MNPHKKHTLNPLLPLPQHWVGPEPRIHTEPKLYDLLLASGVMAALLVLVTLADLIN